MKSLFIDTNVLLSFFHYSSDDLDELSKLVTLGKQGEISLLLPRQLLKEFLRNRASKIADAIIWETLLAKVPIIQDLHFISGDSDYYSPLNSDHLNPFLVDEWEETKLSNIYLYKRLSDFFRAHYKEIKLSSELEKEELLSDLESSSSFQRTHWIVSRLATYEYYTDAQIGIIASIAISNPQISRIINDNDIREFLITTIKPREFSLKYEVAEKLNELMGEIIFDQIPF